MSKYEHIQNSDQTPYDNASSSLSAVNVRAAIDELDNKSGDISGPTSSTDNSLVRFSGTDTKIIKDSLTHLNDSGQLRLEYNDAPSRAVHVGDTDPSVSDLPIVMSYTDNTRRGMEVKNSVATAYFFIDSIRTQFGNLTSDILQIKTGNATRFEVESTGDILFSKDIKISAGQTIKSNSSASDLSIANGIITINEESDLVRINDSSVLRVGDGQSAAVTGETISLNRAGNVQVTLGIKNNLVKGYHQVTTARYAFGTVNDYPTHMRSNNKNKITATADPGQIGMQTNVAFNYQSFSSDTVLSASQHFVGVDTSVSAITITLPSASSFDSSAATTFVIKDLGNAAINNVLVEGHSAETIDGLTAVSITQNYGTLRLFTDRINWYTF